MAGEDKSSEAKKRKYNCKRLNEKKPS